MVAHYPNENGTVRVALYLRMSSKKQDKSIASQRDELTKRIAQRPDHRIVTEYVDEAISGDDTEKRLGFQNLRDDAARNIFDLIFAWDQDRFSRNDPLELGYWLKPIRDAGVKLETLAQGLIDWDTFGGRIVYLVAQEGKHAYLSDLSRNVTRGHLRSAMAGQGSGGGAPYGYCIEEGRLVVVPDQAVIVRRIFFEYCKPGASLRGIAAGLNRDNIPSPAGCLWGTGSVHNRLTNRKYTGAYVRGVTRAGRYNEVVNGEIVPVRGNGNSK